MTRIKLTIAYVGAGYCGWQTQAAAHNGATGERPSVQSAVMRAVERVLGAKVHVHGAGRTDSGVHADAQIAHFDVPDAKAGLDWQLALNTLLPHDIRIAGAQIAAPDFHAQHDALRKTYLYRLWLDRRYTPPQWFPFVWACGPLDEQSMEDAARHLCGRHDFAALRNAGTSVAGSVRTVAAIVREASADWPLLRIWRFEADGFLKQMARNMMGLLVGAGQGRIAVDDVPRILTACDRRHRGTTAPAKGLTLHKVWYAEDLEAGAFYAERERAGRGGTPRSQGTPTWHKPQP